MYPRNFIASRLLAASLLICSFMVAAAFAQPGPQKAPPLPPGMTGSDANDPRAKLSAGLYDAGEISMGLKHLQLIRKPDAFQISVDPGSRKSVKSLASMGVPSSLAFANSDIAFRGNYLFMGNFYGINIYDIADPANAKLITSMLCPGGQGDVTVHNNLLFMSVEMPNGRLDCSEEGFAPPPPPPPGQAPQMGPPVANKDRFRGVRIFDISDLRNPKQVGAVQTCRGSHTHTLLADPKDKSNVYIYVSGTSFVRQDEELAGCSDGPLDKDPNNARFRIDVIKVPLASPQDAKIVSRPRIFGDETGAINALKSAATHGTGRPAETDQCHDITVYPEIGLAAGACSGNGILLDIKDPANPKRIEAVNDANYAYWHSASFSNDGKKVVYTDEWGGGMGARCRENDPNKWGANAIFNLSGGKLNFANYYKLPAAQGESENCVAHNGSLIPIPGRDIKVQAWYQGGISIMDFTDAANPVEIGYFDRGPIDPKVIVMGGSWSAYWYNGKIYSSEIARGLDIFELTPTKFISQNEIDAAKTVQFTAMNVQTQEMNRWPKSLTIAKAYADQLERSRAMPAGKIAELRKAIETAESSKKAGKLKGFALWFNSNAGQAKHPGDSSRMKALAEILNNPAL